MKLGVVIVTYRTRELVRRCVESVKANLPPGLDAHLIVVDNASCDGTVELFREEYPEVELIANNQNRGPAYAYNQGVRAAAGDEYVMMLNSDIELRPGTIPPMVNYLDSHPEVYGALGRLLNPDGTPQYMRVQIKQWRKPEWDQEFQATFVSTCFLMARQTAFARVGLFDEAYYFHNEDLDWSERAQRLGLLFRNLPGVAVWHHGSAGMKQNYGPIIAELYASNLYYFHKFYGPVIARMAMWILLLEIRQRIKRLNAELAELSDPEERRKKGDSIKHLKAGRAKMLTLARSGKLRRWRPQDAPKA